MFLALKRVQMVKITICLFILYITNILLYIVLLLCVFIIFHKYIIFYLQTFNSIDFLQYF